MERVKLLSWNIWGGIFLPEIIRYLKYTNADIVGLQEAEEAGDTNTAEILAKECGYSFVYTRSMEYEWKGRMTNRGNAVLSRFPIVGHKTHLLNGEKPRTAMQADIRVDNRILHVVSVHLVHTGDQENQAERLLNLVPKNNAVIMGDFNATPDSKTIERMRASFRDTDQKDLPSWCLYPDGPEECKPDKVISKYDYIFVSYDLRVNGFAVGDTKGSDHLPVSAMFEHGQ